MKISIIIFSIITLIVSTGCSKKENFSNSEIDEEYVLIEFAAKLEDDFHRIDKHPIEINQLIDNNHP